MRPTTPRQKSAFLLRAGLVPAALSLAAGVALAGGVPVSPTGIPYTLPATARAAGWTIADPLSRTAFFGSNPAFLGGGSRFELALDAAWQQRSLGDHPSVSLDEVESRLAAATGKARFGPLALGVSYQEPFHAQIDSGTNSTDERLRTVVVGAALDPLPMLCVGGSMTRLMLEDQAGDQATYQATLGAEVRVAGASLAAAVKSRVFGSDATRLDEPFWVQLDARLPLGPMMSWGVRLGLGDWKSKNLENPVDFGVGARWDVLPVLGILAGVHHIADRATGGGISFAGFSPFRGTSLLDQGTFLDAGAVLGLSPLHLALAVEDNHVSSADTKSTIVTLSAQAAF